MDWSSTSVVAFQSTLPVWGATPPRPVRSPNLAFQSTLPVWGATSRSFWLFSICKFQSTLPVWGATLDMGLSEEELPVSIHAPRVGSDIKKTNKNKITEAFQSTLPVWGATQCFITIMPD